MVFENKGRLVQHLDGALNMDRARTIQECHIGTFLDLVFFLRALDESTGFLKT